jgi:hypothetical protein
VCTKSALVNGDFHDDLRGWTASGQALRFSLGTDKDANARRYLSTWDVQAGELAGEYIKGTLSQVFSVPADASALRFWVFGGHAHVRLRDAAGTILEDVIGRDSNDLHVPVSWDLSKRRGQMLTLAIEDELSDVGWSFVNVNGFDVIREGGGGGLVNAQLNAGFSGWELSGDAHYFNVFEDHNFVLVDRDQGNLPQAAYGVRQSVSTYVRDTTSAQVEDAATGALAQLFTVPEDATALRFNVSGGRAARVYLAEGNTQLYAISGNNDASLKRCVSWNLTAHRGQSLRLVIEDQATGPYGFIGTSGFDLITSYNGP